MLTNYKQYRAVCARIEELLKVVGNDTPCDDENFVELDHLSDLAADYEERRYPMPSPDSMDMPSTKITHQTAMTVPY
jgi:HTH-type transcriptional regulator/antitoxin HigA